jgi:hypothetical protein
MYRPLRLHKPSLSTLDGDSQHTLADTASSKSSEPTILNLIERTTPLTSIFTQPPKSLPSLPINITFEKDWFSPLCEVLYQLKDRSTLLVIQRVSQAGWDAATPYIYREVRMGWDHEWRSLLEPFRNLNNLCRGLRILRMGRQPMKKRVKLGVKDEKAIQRIRIAWSYVRTFYIRRHPSLNYRALLAVAC